MAAKLNRKNALQKIQCYQIILCAKSKVKQMFLFPWPQTGTDHLQYWLSIHLVCLSVVKKKKEELISTIERKFKLYLQGSRFSEAGYI